MSCLIDRDITENGFQSWIAAAGADALTQVAIIDKSCLLLHHGIGQHA